MNRFTSNDSDLRVLRLPAAAVAIAAAILCGSFPSSGVVARVQRDSSSAPACIAIVTPSVQGVGGNAADFGSSVRDLFASYLKGPSIQVIQLQSRLVSQAMEEARQHKCDHVLTSTVTRKRGDGKLGRVMGQAAGTASWAIPGGGTTRSAIARGAAIGTAQAVATLATTTRAKDEMQLEFRVSSPAGVVAVGPKTEKRKATVDGEDLLTPLVEKVSETVAGTIAK